MHVHSAEQADQLEPLLKQGIVLLWFTAPWCGTCRAVKRAIAGMNRKMVPIVEIDVDRFKPLAERYHVQGVPMLLLLVDGVVVDRKGGSLDHAEFTAWYDSHAILNATGDVQD